MSQEHSRDAERPFSQEINFVFRRETFLIDNRVAVRFRGEGGTNRLGQKTCLLEVASDESILIRNEPMKEESERGNKIGQVLLAVPLGEKGTIYLGEKYKFVISGTQLVVESPEPISVERFITTGELRRKLRQRISGFVDSD